MTDYDWSARVSCRSYIADLARSRFDIFDVSHRYLGGVLLGGPTPSSRRASSILSCLSLTEVVKGHTSVERLRFVGLCIVGTAGIAAEVSRQVRSTYWQTPTGLYICSCVR